MLKKKAVTIILSLYVAISLTACSTESTNPANSGTENGNGSTPVVDNGPVDIWAPYDETVTINTVLPLNKGIPFKDGENYDKNPWYDEFKKNFNIEVKNLWVAQDYSTKLNLSVVDGKLPDVFVVSKTAMLNQLIEGNLIADMTEVFDKYASDDIKKYVSLDKETFKTGYKDGKLYGIAQLGFGIIDQPSQIWLRKDWMEEQKLSAPQTMDDVVNIAKVFMKEYGAYGIGENQNLDSLTLLAPAWGASPGIWIKTKEGKLAYGSVQPEMKAALSTFAQWYKDGILYPDFATSDSTKISQHNINGKLGVQPFGQWWGWYAGVDTVTKNGKNSYFQAYAIPSATSQPVKSPISFSNVGYIVVNKNFKNPEAVIKLINYYAKAMFSGELDNSLVTEFNRMGTIPYAFRIINPMTDYQQFIDVNEALRTKDTSKLVGITKSKYDKVVDFMEKGTPSSLPDYLQLGDVRSSYSVSKKILDDGNIVKDALWGAPPATLESSGSTLDDILIQGFTQIIVGEKPVDYFDTLVKSWLSAGGEQATKEMNEVYK